MGLHQLIPNIENRELSTGTGNWTGDTDWDAGPYESFDGFFDFLIGAAPAEKNIALAYPFIKSLPDISVLYSHWHNTSKSSPNTLLYEHILTDGVYSYTLHKHVGGHVNNWYEIYDYISLPADWNKLNTQLTLRAWNTGPDPCEILFDNFSLTYTTVTKKQYLPLMGVG